MRILFANDGVGDAGGVQQYLAAVAGALRAQGHTLALLHVDPLRAPTHSPIGIDNPHFCTADLGWREALSAAMGWKPTLAFSHNMRVLEVDRGLAARMPVVKMMHGYFGTCISGQKMHAFPHRVACQRVFGAPCAALYLPRHCGERGLRPFVRQYRWARAQHALLSSYRLVVVASDHMAREYTHHGMASQQVLVNPLFATDVPDRPADAPPEFHVVFLGRMTTLKGGDQLIRATAFASRTMGHDMRLTMAGDGPARRAWEALSEKLHVVAHFPGWLDPTERQALFRTASVVVVPSIWPEPFGLTGIEGGAFGVPAVAFDTGGIRSWLQHGRNGWLVDPADGAPGLARALTAAAANPRELAARRDDARRVAEELSLDRHVDVLVAAFHRAAEEGTHR